MATRIVFTDKKIANLPAKDKRYEVYDEGKKGLACRVNPTGIKTFGWYYRAIASGKNTWLGLGRYPAISVDEVRAKQTKAKELHQQGIDPQMSREAPKTFGALVEHYYSDHVAIHITEPLRIRSLLDADILPHLKNLKLHESLKPADVKKPVANAVARGSTTHAGKVLSQLKQIFNHAIEHGYLSNNPANGINANKEGITNPVRNRMLRDDEITKLWSDLDTTPKLSQSIRYGAKVLLLTGIRTTELRLAEWGHINWEQKTLLIPVAVQKTRKKVKSPKPFIVPLSPLLMDMFTELEGKRGDKRYIFPSNRKANAPLSEKAIAHRIRAFRDESDPFPWRPHDFRRNVRSFKTELPFEAHVKERALNHALRGIEAVYHVDADGTDWLEERRKYLTEWSDYVQNLTT